MSKEYLEALINLGAVLADLEIDKDTMLPKFVLSGDRAKNYKIVEQALQRLEAIENSNPSEALKYVNGKIADLEDDLQHYTMVEKDKCREFFIREDLKQFTTIKQALIKAQEQEKENELLKGQVNYLTEVVTEFQKMLEIIKRVYTDLCFILSFDTFEEYDRTCDLISVEVNLKRVDKKEFNLLKRYFK